jgi:hypothetical protein
MNTVQSRRRFLGVLSAGAASAIAPAAVAATLAPAAETALSTPAPAVAPSLPHEAEVPFLDADLMKLVNEYLTAHDEWRRLEEVLNRARKVQEAKYPMPDVLRVQPEDTELELPDQRGVYCGWLDQRAQRTNYHDGIWISALRKPQWKRLVEVDAPDGGSFYHHGSFDPSPAARARADEIVAAYDEWWPRTHRRTARTIEPRYPRGFGAVEKQKRRLDALLSKLEVKIIKTRARTFAGLLAKAKVAVLAAPDLDRDTDQAISAVMHDMIATGDELALWPDRSA